MPPQEPVIHRKVVPDPPTAFRVVDSPAQIVAGAAFTDVGATGNGFTLIVTDKQVELPQVALSQRP